MTNLEKGKLLRDARDRAGLTQKQMAAAMGLDSTYLSQLENGRRPVDEFYLVKAAEIEKSKSSSGGATAADGSLRARCHEHLNKWFDEQQGDEDKLRWAFVELQRRFPVGETRAVNSAPPLSADQKILMRLAAAEDAGPTGSPPKK